jgi:hypothetical protein
MGPPCGRPPPASANGANKNGPEGPFLFAVGGEGGIRTHGTREGTPVFKTGAFNRSATSPQLEVYFRWRVMS